MRKNITTQSEALKVIMNLEASPIGETADGMNQCQDQLVSLMLQLQEFKKGK